MENIIQIEQLSFAFSKHKKILQDISINVPEGSIYGFLGANGTGKSTTIRLIMGLLHTDMPQAIKVFGKPISEIYPEAFHKIGALIDTPAFYSHLSGYDNLRIISMIRELDVSRIDEVLELVGLTDAKNVKMKKYSLGMKQRLAIGIALMSQPELLILDEPVNGLDPQGMVEMRQLLVKLNQEHGITIFISSHLLQEIDKMVTHLGIISDGKMKFEGSKQELAQLYKDQKTKFTVKNAADYVDIFTSEDYELRGNDEISVSTFSQDEIAQINTKLVEKGAKVYEIASEKNLEDWFMEITK